MVKDVIRLKYVGKINIIRLRERNQGMKEQMISVYHRVMKRENFEKAAMDLVKLLAETQRKVPDRPRALYLDIDGHRNEEGGFDDDMMELQQEFAMGFLMEFFTEMNLPLGKVINQRPQNNDVPEQLEIIGSQKSRAAVSDPLQELYIENYSNTEFISEEDVYGFLKKVSMFIRKFNDSDGITLSSRCESFGFMHGWSNYMKELITELFNSFIHGNLISASAMTRALIESYVYIRILKENDSKNLMTAWVVCGLLSAMKRYGEKGEKGLADSLEKLCQVLEIDRKECAERYGKGNERQWLAELIGKKRVTFRDACEYLGHPHIYEDFQSASTFVHGQDILSKLGPFTFYNTIYGRLYLMMEYIFKAIRLYPVTEEMDDEMAALEEELLMLGEIYL